MGQEVLDMEISKEQQEAIELEGAVMKKCPRRPKCSAPDCPLDPFYGDRGPSFPGEEECRAQRPTRLRIVAQAAADGIPTVNALKYGGLTHKEWQSEQRSRRAKERIESLPPEERAALAERLAQGREKRRRQLITEKAPSTPVLRGMSTRETP